MGDVGSARAFSVACRIYVAELISFGVSHDVFIYRYAMVAIDDFDLMNDFYELRMIEITDHLSWRITNNFGWRTTKLVMSMGHVKSTPFFDDVVYETSDYFDCSFVMGVHIFIFA